MTRPKTKPPVQPEWSHRIRADDIGATPVCTTISASPQERKDLARRFLVDSIDFLEAQLTLERDPRNLVLHVSGALKAKVTQPCVVTLEPVTEEIENPVEGWFADPESAVSLTKARRDRESRLADTEFPVLEEREDPEPVVNGEADLGELVTQYLSLAINPYPHKGGVMFENPEQPRGGGEIPQVRKNPFAALKDWKKDG